MLMEYWPIVTTLITVIMAVLGWFLKELWSQVKELRQTHQSHRDHVSDYYIKKDDFKDFRDSIMSILGRIENKLDSKADK